MTDSPLDIIRDLETRTGPCRNLVWPMPSEAASLPRRRMWADGMIRTIYNTTSAAKAGLTGVPGPQRVRPVPLKRRPSVSVVVPCYNYAQFLPFAVKSALSQKNVDLEVLIVDDCSADGSVAVGRQLARSDSRVRMIEHRRNMGHIATYNDGLSQVSGDYVVLLSADDMLTSGSLERSCALLDAAPEVGLVYGNTIDFVEAVPPARTALKSWTIFPGHAWIRRICRRGSNLIVNPEAVLRRSLMDELGGYDPALPHAADMDLWIRAASLADVGRLNGVDQAFYRVHGHNMHSTQFAGLLTDARERARVFESLIPCRGKPMESARLHAMASRSIGIEALRHACLAADRGGSFGGATADDYAEFARSCCPQLARSWRWSAYAARSDRPAGLIRRSAASALYDIRWKLAWRRWRRFGT